MSTKPSNDPKPISLDQFNKEYNQPEERWNFDKFSINCKKCGSTDVEYNGATETEYGYYGAVDFTHFLVVKCHSCGNAFALRNTNSGSSDWCPHDN